jgi:hypothetical protein
MVGAQNPFSMIENFSAQYKQAKVKPLVSLALTESQIIIQGLSTEAFMHRLSDMVVEKMTSRNKEITPPRDVWLSP